MAGPGGRRAIIVGSGFGGLSAAIRLLSDGWRVTILLPVPNLRSGDDWNEAEPRMRERTLAWLEGWGLEGLRESIVVQRSWTPLTSRATGPTGNLVQP